MPYSSDRRSLALATLTMATWGLAGTFVRLIAAHFAGTHLPLALAILGGRLLVSLALLSGGLALFAARTLRSAIFPSLARGETWIAAFFQFVYYLLAVIAFTLAPIGEIALCASTAPLWVLLIRRLRGQEVTRKEFFGAVIALCGVAVIVLPNLLKAHAVGVIDPFPHRAVGDLLSLGSAGVTAVYALLQRQYMAKGISVEPRALSLATFAFGAPLALFLAPVPPATLFAPGLLLLVFGFAVVSTILPTLAFAFASRHLPPVTSATLALLLPVFASSYAAVFLHESPPLTLIPGGALVLLGLWLILRPASE